MFYLLKVLIGRSAKSIDKPFSYYCPIDLNPMKFERVSVSFGNSKKVVGLIIDTPEKIDTSIEKYQEKVGFKISPIISILDDKPLLTDSQDKLAKEMKEYYHCPLISLYQAMLPPSFKPKDSSLSKPKEKDRLMVSVKDTDTSSLSFNERKMYEKIKASGDLFSSAEIRGRACYQSLLSKGLIYEHLERIDRIREVKTLDLKPIKLSEDQQKCKDEIDSSNKTVLLEGVTGSGKTMIYLKLCEEALRSGKTAIVLVPEIALTNHVIQLFKSYFGDKVALMHSSLTPANKMDVYLRIMEGKTSIVIGTRSALFAPLKNLSLIILDEEQSDSYKQTSTPFYDARIVASMRSRIDNAKVILGSATPLVEDRCRALKGLYSHIVLNHKFASSNQVNATFVDMSDLSNLSPKYSSMLSVPLIEAIKENYEKKEQTMILINRRGYSPIVQCKSCHRTMKCPNCDIPLVYHKRYDELNCHRCEYRVKFSNLVCPYCNGMEFQTLGYGTERIQDILQNIFPNMKIARLDRDTSAENMRAKILDGFSQGEYDLLIGTEIIAKGHDFPNVTLAACLFADQGLAIPSYMANERTFDLITQLVGRSGRHEKEGKAIIQTYNPLNKVLILASRQDYNSFYEMEIENRKRFKWPPYCYLTQIIVQGTNLENVKDVAYAIKNYLAKKLINKRSDIFGPYDPYEFKVNNQFFKRILVKFKDPSLVKETFDNLQSIAAPTQKDVKITIDKDPRDS